jgi:hypothetical protein
MPSSTSLQPLRQLARLRVFEGHARRADARLGTHQALGQRGGRGQKGAGHARRVDAEHGLQHQRCSRRRVDGRVRAHESKQLVARRRRRAWSCDWPGARPSGHVPRVPGHLPGRARRGRRPRRPAASASAWPCPARACGARRRACGGARPPAAMQRAAVECRRRASARAHAPTRRPAHLPRRRCRACARTKWPATARSVAGRAFGGRAGRRFVHGVSLAMAAATKTGRTSTPPVVAQGARAAHSSAVVEVGHVDHTVAAELFLGVGKGAVLHLSLVAAHAQRGAGHGREEAVAAERNAGLSHGIGIGDPAGPVGLRGGVVALFEFGRGLIEHHMYCMVFLRLENWLEQDRSPQ